VPPTVTPELPTNTPVPPTVTPELPTNTPVPPTVTPGLPTPYPTPGSGMNCNNVQGYHTVHKGETFYAIGRAYLTHPMDIALCNHVVNPNLIHAGMYLAIPVSPWHFIPSGPAAQRQFTPGGGTGGGTVRTCGHMHTVKRGETLTRFSLRYGVSIWAIVRANNIINPNLIHTGQVLCIP
jgi:LysM repeat protein